MALRDRIQEVGEALDQPNRFSLPRGLIDIGVAAWLFVGAVAALVIVGAFFALSAGISIPLILAAVVGTVGYPLAKRLQGHGANPALAAAAVLIALLLVIGGTIWMTVVGIVTQWPEIRSSIESAAERFVAAAADLGFNQQALDGLVQQALDRGAGALTSVASGFVSNIASSLASGISGIFGLFFGIFISVTLLYYILTDFPRLAAWVGSHIGLPQELGDGIVEDAIDSIRGYFRGTTLTGLAVAVTIGVAAFLLGVPLAVPIGLVTFVTCYIPYFGAIFSGAFAFVIALGAGGLTQAVALLVIVLVAQNVLQTVLTARIMGESLSLHPIVVLVVTMLGGTFGGLLGAALAAPLTALGVRAVTRLRAYGDAGLLDDETESEPA